jgi:hypothetical protein
MNDIHPEGNEWGSRQASLASMFCRAVVESAPEAGTVKGIPREPRYAMQTNKQPCFLAAFKLVSFVAFVDSRLFCFMSLVMHAAPLQVPAVTVKIK